ncbi:TMPIT and/or HOOK domain containing protein [Asbolus verrucosus]|uniref:TMPIT and/or HOOK domain containing protein n=1 Tax=Asbolus verrucosus TaxID=1661398 RepID=A0A482VX70_ASBVE|nr:TMPIT and/or HOOK domain containing protein [Asbolus verrucosus]
MSDQLIEEWRELSEDFKKLEATNKIYQKKLEDVNAYQKECEKQIQHQKYRIDIISKTLARKKDEKSEELKEEILKREAQIHEIQQTLPKESGKYLRVILGNVNVSILNKEDKLKYKSEYEKFKLIFSAVAFVLAVVNLLIISRRVERLYIFMLVWYYCTLTIRESILKVNGSKIKGWWRIHHFISTITAAILLIWPESETWNQFRTTFMTFNAYLSVVQYLQFRYQQGVLYRLKALGERHNMDITVEGFHYWMWRGLSFLFPFLFAVYFFQLYMACTLYSLSYMEGATWHVRTLYILFSILSMGNITTMVMIIPDKFKRNVRLKYKLLSQKLRISTENNSKKDEQ